MKVVNCISFLIRQRYLVGIKGFNCKMPVDSFARCLIMSSLAQKRTVCHSVSSNASTLQLMSPCVVPFRNYAKGKDKKKEKGKRTVAVDENMLSEIVPLEDIKKHMQKAVDNLKEDYVQKLSIRSSTGAIENLHVSFEGKDYSIQELGQVVRKDAKTVIINMVAYPQALTAVINAIRKSGMNLNPQQDGTTLYIPVPKVTAEHRNQLAKNAKTLFVQCRDAVKAVQIKHEKKLRDSSLAQDTVFSAQQQLGSIADKYIATADSLLQTKIKELLG